MPLSTRRFFLLLALFTIGLSFIIYAPTLKVGYLSDDWGYVYLGQHVNLKEAVKFFWQPDVYGNGRGNFRPLPSVLTVLVWKHFYHTPEFLHALSITFHGLIATLVGMFSWKLFKRRDSAIIAALLFVSYPLNTEAVVWLCAWNTLLATIPLLLALIWYAKNNKISYRSFAWIILLVITSLTAKEYALLFPIFAVIINVLLERKIKIRDLIIFIIIDGLYLAWRFAVIHGLGGYVTPGEQSVLTIITPHNLLVYVELPLIYILNFFNQAEIPHWLNIAARTLMLSIIFLIFNFLIFKKNSPTKKQTVKILLLLLALVYSGNLLGWNLMNAHNAYVENSRILYMSTVWASLGLGYALMNLPKRYAYASATILILIFSILSYYQSKPWIRAGAVTKKINQQLIEATSNGQPTKIEITNLPDSIHGAFIYRNGFDFAVALIFNTEKEKIATTKSWQPQLDHPLDPVQFLY